MATRKPKDEYLGLWKGELPESIPSWGRGRPVQGEDRIFQIANPIGILKNSEFERGHHHGDRPFERGNQEGGRPFERGSQGGGRPNERGSQGGGRPNDRGSAEGGRPYGRGSAEGGRGNPEGNRGNPEGGRSFDRGNPGGGHPERVNEWGVTIVEHGMPKPGVYLLDDITKWDKVIKMPELIAPVDKIDWAKVASDATGYIDRENYGVVSPIGNGAFMFLVNFMGFVGALTALVDEPEAVEEFFDWANGYFVPIAKYTIEYFKPDIAYMDDDTASKMAPFMSPDVYRKLLKPTYNAAAKYAVERGIPIQFHNAGKCETLLGDMVDIGVKYWDPAQTDNDLVAAKANHKDLVVVGGFDYVPPADGSVSEEAIREQVRATIDLCAPGGRYAWMGRHMGDHGDDTADLINTWIVDEVASYGKDYYSKH
jgi:hypothetical protein